ncbi:uncharacterized protein LOC131147824 [Malania oleifera]|uniref:uncharacterized protein LOC131147824 n=1 Tax=Malania oleifera TaxID=397392 RepID=UPI0025AE89D8|nr:uncharacterized protein LOC131147824 [Malania oleifera]
MESSDSDEEDSIDSCNAVDLGRARDRSLEVDKTTEHAPPLPLLWVIRSLMNARSDMIIRTNKKVPWSELFVKNRDPANCAKEALKNLMATWRVKVVSAQHDKGWIVFKFLREEDANEVIMNGPYSVHGRNLILKGMPRFFQFRVEQRTVVPVWIQLKDLPFELWHPCAIGRICSQTGRPLCMDKLTTIRYRISARAMVEVDVAKEIKYSVDIMLPDGMEITQEIVYEGLPRFCTKCKALGHSAAFCKPRAGPKKPAGPQYRPKRVAQTSETEIDKAGASNAIRNKVKENMGNSEVPQCKVTNQKEVNLNLNASKSDSIEEDPSKDMDMGNKENPSPVEKNHDISSVRDLPSKGQILGEKDKDCGNNNKNEMKMKENVPNTKEDQSRIKDKRKRG